MPKLEVDDWRTADAKTCSQYVCWLFEEFKRHIGQTADWLPKIVSGDALVSGECTVEGGPRKSDERIFEKARVSYANDLQRITDFQRGTIVCSSFELVSAAFETLCRDIHVVKVKNRFATANQTAKDSGGYRDLQLVLMVGPPGLLLEVQVHLAQFHALKMRVAQEEDPLTGATGHERYVQFRTLKELAKANLHDILAKIRHYRVKVV